MSPTEAQKQARNKWDKENMKNVACKITAEKAEAFKQYAQSKNTTPNALLREFIESCISSAGTGEGNNEKS